LRSPTAPPRQPPGACSTIGRATTRSTTRSALLAQAGAQVESVPHCCSEAGTLALSRPDIAYKMLSRKKAALESVADADNPTPFVTNCPSCLQGLGRQV